MRDQATFRQTHFRRTTRARRPEPLSWRLLQAFAGRSSSLFLIADFTGRGSERSRAFITADVVVCLLENGATRGERNIAAAGRADVVRLGRDVLQRAMEDQLVAAVERLTGRRVRTFLSGSSTLGESAVEVFVLEPDRGVRKTDAPG